MILLEIAPMRSEYDFIFILRFIGIVNAKRTPAIVGCMPDFKNKSQTMMAEIIPSVNEYFLL
jgi:hypothetical protein